MNGQMGHRKLDRSLSEPKQGLKGSSQNGNNSTNSSRYKTELCRPFEESGVCKYGDKCQFAHGYQELRTLTRHPKYKTELCCTFHTTGLCPYGSRCHFIHNPDENRNKMISSGAIHSQVAPPAPMANHHPPHPVHAGGHIKTLHTSLSSPAIGMTSHPPPVHQNSLRSLSLGSSASLGSNGSSSGELSPSSSPGMFDDPFSPGFYAPHGPSRALSGNPFAAFNADYDMSTLAAAFSAAEGHNLLKGGAASAPPTPPFGSQINLLGSTGPWSSPSADMFQFPSVLHPSSLGLSQPSVSQAHHFEGQSSPVDSLTFEFDSISLGVTEPGGASPGSRGSSAHSPLTRLPIFNQLANSD